MESTKTMEIHLIADTIHEILLQLKKNVIRTPKDCGYLDEGVK